MGGGLDDNMWNPYSNGGYGYPQSRSYRPREGVPERGAPQFFNRASQEPVKKAVRTIPVTDGNEVPVPKAPVPERKAPVPVKARFESKDAAATKIQAVNRGYCVRKFQPLKNLKVIKAVQGELDTFKNRFQETEQKKKLLSDSQERLRWAEGIMALLLRLDSLQGVSPEVRLIRKALSKELLMFQETIDTLSMDSAQLNGKEDSSEDAEVTDAVVPEDAEVTDAATPEDAEVTDAAALEDAEVTDAAVPEDAEVTDAAVPVDAEVIHAAAPEDAEVTDAASRKDAEAYNAVFRKAAEPIIAAFREIAEASAIRKDAEVADAASRKDAEPISAFRKTAETLIAAMRMDAEMGKASSHRDADVTEAAEVIDASPPQEVEGIHAEPESMDIEGSTTEQEADQDMGATEVVPEVHSDSNKEYVSTVEAPMDVENSKERVLTTSPAVEAEAETAGSLDENQEDGFVIVSPEHASLTRSGEEMRSIEQDAEDMAMEAETRRDASAEGCIVPTTTALAPAFMETSSSPTSELSDRALLLQVLEENRKLRDVVSKVLQWGKHQNDTIHNLTSRIEQLEQHQPPLKQKKGRKVGHKRLLVGDIDSEDADSDEYF